jgi:serine/threonine protein kinase
MRHYVHLRVTQDSGDVILPLTIESAEDGAELSGAALPEAEVWRTFLQILLGVAYLHSKRTLHRDLKTANVFLTGPLGAPGGAVKIGDLGVARVLGSETAFARTCVGTPLVCVS